MTQNSSTTKTATQNGLDVVLIVSVVVLLVALFVPNTPTHNWLAVLPLLTGACVAVLTAISRKW